MNIRIRNAVPQDCVHIRPLQEESTKLHQQGRPELFKGNTRFYTAEEFQEKLNNPNNTLLIAEDEAGTVVGYVSATLISNRNNPDFFDYDLFCIVDICVSLAHRRNGIGTKLFEACKARAKALHCQTMDLRVWSFNKAAISFYESCGMHNRVQNMEYVLE